jgi:hypothetical protein
VPHEDAAAVRPGFRRAWIDDALRPVEHQLGPESLRRLKLALGAVLSAEALIALKDIMGVDSAEAIAVCRWMARTLTAAVVGESQSTGEAD